MLSMQQRLHNWADERRFYMAIMAVFAGLALGLSVLGLYGVLAYTVTMRSREIGIRMALGATRSSVALLVLRQGIVVIGSGLAVGLLLAFAVCRLITGFLYQVKPLDGWTYFAVALALPAIGLSAALLPARRAASIQPMQALREE
jgi:ABC-type antimicrobial peptide transport system permease subunit